MLDFFYYFVSRLSFISRKVSRLFFGGLATHLFYYLRAPQTHEKHMTVGMLPTFRTIALGESLKATHAQRRRATPWLRPCCPGEPKKRDLSINNWSNFVRGAESRAMVGS